MQKNSCLMAAGDDPSTQGPIELITEVGAAADKIASALGFPR